MVQALCFFLAKKPNKPFTAEELTKSIGRFDAPLSAFAGGGKAGPSLRRFAGAPMLQGWRCLQCGHAEATPRDIEACLANDIVPLMVFQGCEALTVDQFVDRVLSGDIADMKKRRDDLVTAFRESRISLTDRDGWMRPCPSCKSDDTAVYRWKRVANEVSEFEPADDNLPMRKMKQAVKTRRTARPKSIPVPCTSSEQIGKPRPMDGPAASRPLWRHGC